MPGPNSTKRGLPTILGGDSPDVVRDFNALVTGLENEVGYLAERDVLDVGMVGQTRAGRALTPTDFTELGLSLPLAIWNLSGLTDASGNGRALTNKGAVPFGVGIEGAASSAAIFSGSTAQSLYIADTGAADPFRIRTGSWAAWCRTAKRAQQQMLMAKESSASRGWQLYISSSNLLSAAFSYDGTNYVNQPQGVTDVCDDRWHLLGATHDGGTFRLYLDGALEASVAASQIINPSSGPLNLGSQFADAATAATTPHFGRLDEAFVTTDVLSEEEFRLLYAIKLAHGAPRTPRRAGATVRRRRRGTSWVTADLPSTPLRNYRGGQNADAGSNNQALTLNPGTGLITAVSGPDGTPGQAYHFQAAHTGASATDAGLPAGTAVATLVAWFKAITTAAEYILDYGGVGTERYLWINGSGYFAPGDTAGGVPAVPVNDGQWHMGAVVFNPAAADGLLRKTYVDGRLASSDPTALTSIVLGGANSFRIGAKRDGTSPFAGQIGHVLIIDAALTGDQIRALYYKPSRDLGISPIQGTVERTDGANLHVIGEAIEPQNRINLEVAA